MNAISKRILTLVLTLIIAAGMLQPVTLTYADYDGDECFEAESAAEMTWEPEPAVTQEWIPDAQEETWVIVPDNEPRSWTEPVPDEPSGAEEWIPNEWEETWVIVPANEPRIWTEPVPVETSSAEEWIPDVQEEIWVIVPANEPRTEEIPVITEPIAAPEWIPEVIRENPDAVSAEEPETRPAPENIHSAEEEPIAEAVPDAGETHEPEAVRPETGVPVIGAAAAADIPMDVVAVMNPGTHSNEPEEPGFTRHPFSKETEEKILETIGGMIPFGKTVYHVVRITTNKPADTGKIVEDVASDLISNSLNTLMPGAGSLFSVAKDVIKKLFR